MENQERIQKGERPMSKEQIPAGRRETITSLIKENGLIKVATLSEMFNVTDLTIRRDLEKLEKDGILTRTHGGGRSSEKQPG